MRISRIDGYEVVVPAIEGRVNSEAYGPPVFDTIPKLIIEVHTDSGLVGLGETLRGCGEASIRSAVTQFAGKDILKTCFQEPSIYDLSSDDMFAHEHPHRPHRFLERNFNTSEHLAIHCALLDLLGKQTNLPVSALMGGAYRNRVAVDTWMGRMTPEDSARICLAAKAS